MSIVRSSLLAAGAVATGVLLGACAQHSGAALPITAGASARVNLPDANPPQCKGQKNEQYYATVTAKLKTKGGAFCIPEFGGFGGKVQYPSVDPSVKLTLTSSTTDYNNLPQLGSGTAIFYLQLSISGGTSFGSNTKAGGGLTSQAIVAGDDYTAFGEAVIFGYHYKFKPCYTVATQGKYGGVIGGLGSLLKGVDVPTSGSGFIEVYSGQQASEQC
jgi:hypothetical protein